MAYSIDPSDYREDELYRVAELHFVERMTHQAISHALGIRPRARVVAMCEAARRSGLVRVAILPSRAVEGRRLRDLAARVRERFNLLDCVVVHGRCEMLRSALPDNVREVILDDIAREAAAQIDRRFGEAENPCLAVTYGFVTRKIADFLQPEAGLLRAGLVVSAQGVRRIEVDRFDANNIVRDIARQFGSSYACMPIPALVDAADLQVVRNLPLVKPVLNVLETKASIVVGSLASSHQTDAELTSDSLQNDLLARADVDSISSRGGIGNFGGWWFDHDGETVEYPARSVVGLGLARIRQLVQERKPVILAVGADPTRIPALAVALSCKKKLGNVWIGDEVTARILLGEHKLDRADISWTPAEKKVLECLVG